MRNRAGDVAVEASPAGNSWSVCRGAMRRVRAGHRADAPPGCGELRPGRKR